VTGFVPFFLTVFILNEVRVQSYIQAILRREDLFVGDQRYLRDTIIDYRGTLSITFVSDVSLKITLEK